MQQHDHRNMRYRLLPGTAESHAKLENLLESQRWLSNQFLEDRIKHHRKTGRALSYYAQCKILTVKRRRDPRMKADPVQVQRGTLQRLDQACKASLHSKETNSPAGFPRFRGRAYFTSITVAEGARIKDGRLCIPGFGKLKIRRRGGNPYEKDGKVVSAVLEKKAGKWHVTVCFKIPRREKPDNGVILGVDTNAGQVATSQGKIYWMPKLPGLIAEAKRLSRKMNGQVLGSARRAKTRAQYAKVLAKIAAIRRNWRHHVSKALAEIAAVVVIEKMNTKGMTQSGKGTVENPDRKVRQKAGMNRVILATGWSEFWMMLQYKARTLIRVNPWNTSRTCSSCGHVDAMSRRSQAVFHCVSCDAVMDADINAADNIRALGTDVLTRGEMPLGTSLSRENIRKDEILQGASSE